MRIAIIGGSITGLSAASLLLKQGYDVTIYEQHQQNLKRSRCRNYINCRCV